MLSSLIKALKNDILSKKRKRIALHNARLTLLREIDITVALDLGTKKSDIRLSTSYLGFTLR